MDQSATMLVVGGIVVPRSDQGSVIQDGAVAIRGNRVVEVGPASTIVRRHAGASIMDASGKLIMPGLINCHTHLYSSLARGMTTRIEPSADFVEILEHLWWRLDRALTDEDVRHSALVGALDLIRNGTTTIVDHHASQGSVSGSLSVIADALLEVGLRANLCFEVSDRDGARRRDEGLKENERFARWIAASDDTARGRDQTLDSASLEELRGMRSASFGLHASFTLEDDTLERAARTARDLGIGCHIHVAEDEADVEDSVRRSGKRVVERLNQFGILGEKTVAAHCVHVDRRERELLKDTGTVVVHNPQSNMNNAVGCADVPGFVRDGLLVGLGTDGFTASMFDEMKVANIVHRHATGDPSAGNGLATQLGLASNPVIASRLIGDDIGRLVPGALADLIVVDYVPPTPLVERNFEGHLLFGMGGGMVETVIVNGRVIMEQRKFRTVDEGEIKSASRELAARLWKRM